MEEQGTFLVTKLPLNGKEWIVSAFYENGRAAELSCSCLLYTSIDPVDQAYAEGTLTIDSLTVRQNGIVTISLEGAELKEYFTGNEQVSFADADAFTFSVTGEDPQLLPTAQLQALYTQSHLAVFLIGWLGSGLLIALLALLIRWVWRQAEDCSLPVRITCLVFLAGLLGAVLMVVYTGLRSPFWLNPDAVSYTHLDVYKRQGQGDAGSLRRVYHYAADHEHTGAFS